MKKSFKIKEKCVAVNYKLGIPRSLSLHTQEYLEKYFRLHGKTVVNFTADKQHK